MILGHADYALDAAFDADVVVVGTGAGGAAAGAELAEAGLNVAFIEEGSYHPTSSFNPYATETVPRLYRDASSTMIFGRPNISYLEGRCVGGSTVLNGGMAYRAPEHVLDEWERRTGSVEMGARQLDRYYERVEGRVNVAAAPGLSVGGDSRLMVEGAKKLGWKYEVNRRNQRACVGANNCVFGCPTGAKQSTLVTYIPAALAAGARCFTDVRVTRLMIERGRCVGVIGRAMNPRTRRFDRAVRVRARAVVIAAGAVQTPYLLLRHGLGRPSGRLGKNLLCHPNVKVVGVYPMDVMAWKGVNQYGQIREFDAEGIVLAENMVPPGALAALIPFVGRDAWELMKRYNQLVATGALVEDSTTGTVSRGPFALAVARYDVTARDHERFVKGAKRLAELHFAMGAEAAVLPFATCPIVRSMDELAKLDATTIERSTLELLTVHVMGTAAMGSRSTDSVVGLDGQLWDLPGCYVADASLFPSAIGRNPQITIMALATRVAHRLADTLATRPDTRSTEEPSRKPPMTTARSTTARVRKADAFIGRTGGRIDLPGLASWLDGLEPDARTAVVSTLSAEQQALLYEAVQGFRPITLDHFVPVATPPRVQTIHGGRNSLPAFTRFEKRFCRPDVGASRLWGYNEVSRPIRSLAGPGYFVCSAVEGGEVLIDYCELPPETLESWPRLVPNSARLGRFVYHGTKDTMRGVSKHVSVGRAARKGRPMDNWFVLCRRDVAGEGGAT